MSHIEPELLFQLAEKAKIIEKIFIYHMNDTSDQLKKDIVDDLLV